MDVQRVGVVGCGLMGSGVAEAAARAELDVCVVDLTQQIVDRGRQRLLHSMERAAKAAAVSGRSTNGSAADRLLEDHRSRADRQIVVEAVVESGG